MFAVLEEKQQDKGSLWYMKSYLNTLRFSQQEQHNDQDVPFWIFLSPLQSLWLNE